MEEKLIKGDPRTLQYYGQWGLAPRILLAAMMILYL
jgi:hypothetical protein